MTNVLIHLFTNTSVFTIVQVMKVIYSNGVVQSYLGYGIIIEEASNSYTNHLTFTFLQHGKIETVLLVVFGSTQ